MTMVKLENPVRKRLHFVMAQVTVSSSNSMIALSDSVSDGNLELAWTSDQYYLPFSVAGRTQGLVSLHQYIHEWVGLVV